MPSFALLQLEQMELDFQAGEKIVAARRRASSARCARRGACRAASAGRRRKTMSHSIQPECGAQGRTRNVAGSGSISTSAAPSSSFMPKPPPGCTRPGTPCGARCPSGAWWPRSRRRSSAPRRSRLRQTSCRAARRAGRQSASRTTDISPAWMRRSPLRASLSCVRRSRGRRVRPGSCGLRPPAARRRAAAQLDPCAAARRRTPSS